MVRVICGDQFEDVKRAMDLMLIVCMNEAME